MLIFPLKKEWYEKIKSGEKRIEYREAKPYWTKRLLHAEYSDYCAAQHVYKKHFIHGNKKYFVFERYEAPCFFRLGYTKERLDAWITKIEVVDGKDTDLHIDKPVYAIHFKDVRRVPYPR